MDAILLTAVSLIVCIATLVTSLTIILLHFKSTVLRDDVVVKMMASLCVSGLGLGFLVPAASFVMAQWGADDPWLATFQGFVFGACRISTLWQLAFLAVFKCCVISRPLQYFRLFTARVINATIGAIWIVSLLIVLGCLLGGLIWKMDPELLIAFNSNSTLYLVLGFELHITSTSLIVIGSYFKIFLVVRQHLRQISSITLANPELTSVSPGYNFQTFQTGTGNTQGSTNFAASVRSAKNLFIISFSHLFTYLPGALISAKVEMPTWMMFVGKWLYLASSAENSLLYIILHKTVRRELAKFLRLARNRWRR